MYICQHLTERYSAVLMHKQIENTPKKKQIKTLQGNSFPNYAFTIRYRALISTPLNLSVICSVAIRNLNGHNWDYIYIPLEW